MLALHFNSKCSPFSQRRQRKNFTSTSDFLCVCYASAPCHYYLRSRFCTQIAMWTCIFRAFLGLQYGKQLFCDDFLGTIVHWSREAKLNDKAKKKKSSKTQKANNIWRNQNTQLTKSIWIKIQSTNEKKKPHKYRTNGGNFNRNKNNERTQTERNQGIKIQASCWNGESHMDKTCVPGVEMIGRHKGLQGWREQVETKF